MTPAGAHHPDGQHGPDALDELEAELRHDAATQQAAPQQAGHQPTVTTAGTSAAGVAEGDAGLVARFADVEALLQPAQPTAGTADSDEAFVPCFDSLEEWVVNMFAPTYARRSTPSFRWCAQWWRHPEAISRLEALWRSWEALRLDPLLGMSSWYAGHLDHQLPILTGAAGPFADCDPAQHFPPEHDRLAHHSPPADWWPPASG